MATRKQMVEERNARIDAKQRENEIQGKLFSHPAMRKEMRRQELVREFMLALASRFDYEYEDSAEDIYSAAFELASKYMENSKAWLDDEEFDARLDIERA
jgi:hypothetical protein